jgi:hypothetical protein
MLNTASKRIDRRQIVKIHTLMSAIKLSDKNYRETLLQNFGVTTSRALTYGDASALIDVMEKKALEMGVWTIPMDSSKYENLGLRPGMASPAQLRKIEGLWKDVTKLGSKEDRVKTLRAFLNRRFNVSDLRFLEADKVRRVICALENMKKQKDGEPS